MFGHFTSMLLVGYGQFVTRTVRYGQFVTDSSLHDTSLHGHFVTRTLRYMTLRYTDTSLQNKSISLLTSIVEYNTIKLWLYNEIRCFN